MSRVVYIGGFGDGRTSAEGVGSALENHINEVDVFTFSDYVNDSKRVQRASEEVHLITHSAGAMAIADADIAPNFAHLLNPPLPRSTSSLLTKTVLKQFRMSTPGIAACTLSDLASAANYSASSIAELATHPIANLGNLPNISRFDSVTAAILSKNKGIHSRLIWTEYNVYFTPSEQDIRKLSSNGLQVAVLPGEHDEVVLKPYQFIDAVLATAK